MPALVAAVLGLLVVAIGAAAWTIRSYRVRLHLLEDERRQAREIGDLHFHTVEALVLAIEGHDDAKHGRLLRVRIYADDIGRRLHLSAAELHALQAAALLHDIGKLAVPEHIITKPGRHDQAEIERMKVHASAGAEILKQVAFPYPVAPIVRAHHERWDGSGYPDGLHGPQIPVGARILAVIDCLDALVTDRYHRRALTLIEAIDHLRSESGKSFDPEVVAHVLMRYAVLEDRVRAAAAESSPDLRSVLPQLAAARHEEQHFFQLARDLSYSLSLDQTLAACANRVQALCPHDSLVIFLRRDHTLRPEYVAGAFSHELSAVEIAWGTQITGRAAEQRTAMVNSDPREELAVCVAASAQLRSMLTVPIEGASETIGAISLYARHPDAFTLDHVRILSNVAGRGSAAIENALRYTEAEQSATTDVLTGLANTRSLFAHLDGELARAKRNRTHVTVLVCDLDRFKQLNDLYGHLEGNRALRAIADGLKRQCREYDFVARLGGDEFVIVLPDFPAALIDAKIEQLQVSVAAAVTSITGTSGAGMSVGHAFYPGDGTDAEALLATADRRMYHAKQQVLLKSADTTAAALRRLSETLGPRNTP
jgi:diguanylate cyclase (GGDEF)-like protein/putative nucleotidyltransferase with HDIG domain